MSDLPDHVEKSILSRELLREGQRILAAVSGGLDSAVMLQVLHQMAGRHGWRITVAHFNHRLRGRSSDADEELVRRTARILKMPFVAARADVRVHAKRQGVSIEMAARQLRHKFLADAARKRDIPTVALAHHADDQVELFFLRALRGSGGEGLGGMKWRGPSPIDPAITLVRPLLDAQKGELLRFARQNRITFRRDASNDSRGIPRNRIRHELIPMLRRRFQPALVKTILRDMEIAGAEAEAVTLTARKWLKIGRPRFARLPVAVQRRVLQLQLLQRKIAADFEIIEQLRGQPDARVNVAPNVSISRESSGRVRAIVHQPLAFDSSRRTVQLGRKRRNAEFDGLRFQWRFVARIPFPAGHAAGCEFFDAERVGDRVCLRHWQPGDRFQPIGMSKVVKLQNWFTNLRIPAARRRELVVAVADDGEIFWVEDQRISERYKLTPQTRRILAWGWKRVLRLEAPDGDKPRNTRNLRNG